MNVQKRITATLLTASKIVVSSGRSFLIYQIHKRHNLGYIHREEKNTLRSIKNYSELAVVIQRQVSEIMEFLVLQREEQWRLRYKHGQEKLDLIKADQ